MRASLANILLVHLSTQTGAMTTPPTRPAGRTGCHDAPLTSAEAKCRRRRPHSLATVRTAATSAARHG
jgi:hypothetical protein